jgi:thiamine kinase-like enzyme
MNEGVSFGSISTGELYGVRKILQFGFEPVKFTWFDTGCIEGIEDAQKYFNAREYNILPKKDEAIWFIEDKVIKYSNDKDFIFERIERNKRLDGLIPKIIDHRENMYVYKYINGTTLSKCINLPIFKRLLTELNTFWNPYTLSEVDSKDFKLKCLDFYKTKTLKRIDNYFIKSNYEDQEEVINGVLVPTTAELLEQIDWNNIADGNAVSFHGDLHFENIVLTEVDKFLLVDWRQNFAGLLEYGDVYYDLAKLLHGIIVSHDMITNDLYSIKDEENTVTLNIHRNQVHVEIEQYFYKFLEENQYDIKKVKILTALIYLNIASLHHYPYSKFLYFFGKYMLNNILNERS